MGFIEAMRERGLVAQITHEEELSEHLESGCRTAYVGFDPTADSLHVGHLMGIMGLRRWQNAGHRVIALMGGGTALVGDPTGKTDMRKMLSSDEITASTEKIKKQIEHFLDLSSPDRGIMVNNADWLTKLQYLPFLRDIGPHFSVNRMLTAECFKQRLEKGLSFLEFNYMLLQSYDFLHLFRTEGCSVQMGGDDQWSNILAGMELVRRLTDDGKAYCLTWPLVTNADGKKMGKTEKGAVWLDPARTSPYEYFQFWRNVEDQKVEDCLRYFTELDLDQIGEMVDGARTPINEAKKVLAFECTRALHGEQEAVKARKTADDLFSGSGSGTGSEPIMTIDPQEFGKGMNIIDLLVAAKIFPSKSEARRLIQQGGLAINGEKVQDIGYQVAKTELNGDEGCLVKKGKKYYYRIRFSK